MSWSSSLCLPEVTSPSPVKGFEHQDKDLHNDSNVRAVMENKWISELGRAWWGRRECQREVATFKSVLVLLKNSSCSFMLIATAARGNYRYRCGWGVPRGRFGGHLEQVSVGRRWLCCRPVVTSSGEKQDSSPVTGTLRFLVYFDPFIKWLSLRVC